MVDKHQADRLTRGRLTKEGRICYSRNYLEMCGICLQMLSYLPLPFPYCIREEGRGGMGSSASADRGWRGGGGVVSRVQ